MRHVFVKALMALAITALGAIAADNTLGSWKVNMEKSKFSPSAPVKSLAQNREAADHGVKVTMTGERADGTMMNGGYTAQYDGNEYPATEAPYDKIALRQVNDNTLTAELRNTTNKYKTTARSVVSANGKTMTTIVKGVDGTGQRVKYTLVYEKQ